MYIGLFVTTFYSSQILMNIFSTDYRKMVKYQNTKIRIVED
jgi:hypothetical protein